MPLAPNVGTGEAETVAAIYRDAELSILARIVAGLEDGIDGDADRWELEQLARLQNLSEEVLAQLAKVNPSAAREIRAALDGAYTRGGAAVLADVGRNLDAHLVATGVKRAAVAAFAGEVSGGLAAAQSAIIRTTPDLVRQVIASTVANTITGTATRREAAQAAITQFLGHGLTGIETARGSMGLADYAAMAVRTANTRAAIQGHTATMLENGLGLVVIHPGPRPCDVCDIWARTVLSIDGTPAGTITVEGVIGPPVEVEVGGTLDDAISDGYQHPNCRCGIEAFLPGVTDSSVIEREQWDAEGYAAQQRQREIEREIRTWRLESATSITDDRRAEADAKVAEWQAAQREHLRANEELKRQYSREQIDGPART